MTVTLCLQTRGGSAAVVVSVVPVSVTTSNVVLCREELVMQVNFMIDHLSLCDFLSVSWCKLILLTVIAQVSAPIVLAV
jgi:hypothetical protein